MPDLISRRNACALLTTVFLAAAAGPARAQRLAVSVYRDPSCGCCGGWAEHLRAAGHEVRVEETADLDPIKRRLGIPADLWACHSASVAGYAIEGHVPAHALRRLLAERPSIGGLAVPGMPIGSPGMEGGQAEIYSVIAFAGDERKVFGRYRGSAPA